MTLEENIKWIGEVMAEIGPSNEQKDEEWNTFDVKQANAIIDYIKIRYVAFLVIFIFHLIASRKFYQVSFKNHNLYN